MKVYFFAFFIFVVTNLAFGKKSIEIQANKKSYGIKSDYFLRVPPPKEFYLKSGQESNADIQVTFNNFPDEAIDAFHYAVDIWESLLHTEQTIYVHAIWMELEYGDGENVLGAAGPSDFFINEEGLPKSGVFYNTPLAEKLTRSDLNTPESPDIYAYFNSTAEWYFGTDGNTPSGLFDFVTIVIHELCHGLGFMGSMDEIQDGIGVWGNGTLFPFSYDRFVINGDGQHLLDTSLFQNPSKELYEQYTSGDLFFSGPVVLGNLGSPVPLYSPPFYDSGSSIDHVANTYNETENSLMTSGITTATSIHDPGLVTMSIMEEVGWSNVFFEHTSPPNSETDFQLAISVRIEADFETIITDPKVVYTVNGLNQNFIPLAAVEDSGLYETSFNVDSNSVVHYYISATDKYQREFLFPGTAPDKTFEVKLQADTIAPTIVHIANEKFYSDEEDDLLVIAHVEDAFGIDTVYLEYAVNGTKYSNLGLRQMRDGRYNVLVNFDNIGINFGDSISYRIVAQDKSKAGNYAFSPDKGYYHLGVDRVPEFITSYVNDFSSRSNDFILDGFDFTLEKGFESAALNSEHPYKNGGEDTWLDFTAQLRYPVLIDEHYHFMRFDEIALIEPGEPGVPFDDSDFYDYVLVEGSNDQGQSWVPFEDGYDARLYTEWLEAYNQSFYLRDGESIAELDLFRTQLMDLTQPEEFSSGDTILIRFRLNSDPYEVGWGWIIDNLDIQSLGVNSPDLAYAVNEEVKVFPNPVVDGALHVHVMNSDTFELVLYDFSGKKVFSKNGLRNKQLVQLPSVAKGLHILQLIGDKSNIQVKVLLK